MPILNRLRAAFVALVITAATALAPALAPAQSVTPVDLAGGVVVLPISGLEIELPAAPAGCRYAVTGRWALDEGEYFIGQDEIETVRGDSLIAYDVVWMGYFGDDQGQAVINNLPIANAWDDKITRYDMATHLVRCGVMDLEGRGPTPTAAISLD